jgi:hypothetical protein
MYLGLIETIDGFGDSIVVGISDTSDRRLDAALARPRSI